MSQTGYEDNKHEEDVLPPPTACVWELEQMHVADSTSIYASVSINGEVVGSIRLPTEAYYQYARGEMGKWGREEWSGPDEDQ